MKRANHHAQGSTGALRSPAMAGLSGLGAAPSSACRAIVLGVGLSALLLFSGACSSDATDAPTGRPRPTDTAGAHDHSGESSGLAPDIVLPSDIAALGEGPPEGGSFEVMLGINVCGRFLELPGRGPSRGVSVDDTGSVTIAPGPGDPRRHEVTVGSVLDLMDVLVATGEMTFGSSWASTVALVGGEETPMGDVKLATGDSCGRDLGEVQLWYYTPEAVASGEDIRMVVTDPQDVPIVLDGSAITIAFAPSSSLPTLPPAALVN